MNAGPFTGWCLACDTPLKRFVGGLLGIAPAEAWRPPAPEVTGSWAPLLEVLEALG